MAPVFLGRKKRSMAEGKSALTHTCLGVDCIRFEIAALFANDHLNTMAERPPPFAFGQP
jgi:hypothetical protein